MTETGIQRKLDTTQSSNLAKLLKQQFANKIVGQEPAVQVLIDMFEAYQSGLSDPYKPAGVALFLGPTGCGKTHVAETFAESLFGSRRACVRIDCAELQHSHEIARLIGSPAGYLGHRETPPAINQAVLDKYHTEAVKLSLVLFDEVEKASDALWNLLLGVLDNATLTLGTNEVVNFSKTIVVLTSNLGAREIANRGIGFAELEVDIDDARKEKVALSAAKAKFSPELMNRLQHIVTFKTLTKEQLKSVLAMELYELKFRLFAASSEIMQKVGAKGTTSMQPKVPRFTLMVSSKAKAILLEDGWDPAYGARHLKRAIDRRIQVPLAKLLGSQQIHEGDTVIVDDSGGEMFDFFCQGAVILGANGENALPVEGIL
jgi:ATP-dependent Clp protease ATP-binding subunit ClpB